MRHPLGTRPKPEVQKLSSGGYVKGPRMNPASHSSLKVASITSGC